MNLKTMTNKNGLPTIKVGRPTKSEAEKRILITTIKQTPEEKEMTRAVAKHFGKSVNGLLNEAVGNLFNQAFGKSGISD